MSLGPHATEEEYELLNQDMLKAVEVSRKCPSVALCYGVSLRVNRRKCLVMKLYKGGTLQAMLETNGEQNRA